MADPWISVVIPTYNEREALPATVEAVRGAVQALGRPYEILVVDNASDDGTLGAMAPLLDGSRVRALSNDANRGKGYSVRRGMLEARGALRLHCDADCAPSLASLGSMLGAIEGADVVAGSRLAPGAQVGRRQPLRRRIAGRGFVLLCRALLSEPTTDLFCGFKLFRAEAAREAFGRSRLEGWTYDAEVLALARALGFRIRETGIVWADRPSSRLSMTRVLVPVTRELLAARRHVRREARLGRAGAAQGVRAEHAEPRS